MIDVVTQKPQTQPQQIQLSAYIIGVYYSYYGK